MLQSTHNEINEYLEGYFATTPCLQEIHAEDIGPWGATRLAEHVDPNLGVNPLALRNAVIRWIQDKLVKTGKLDAIEIVGWSLDLDYSTQGSLRFTSKGCQDFAPTDVVVKHIVVQIGQHRSQGQHDYRSVMLNNNGGDIPIDDFISQAPAPIVATKTKSGAITYEPLAEVKEYPTQERFIADLMMGTLGMSHRHAKEESKKYVKKLVDAGEMESTEIYTSDFLRGIIREYSQ